MGGVLDNPSLHGRFKLKVKSLGVITLLLFGMVIFMTGIVCADQPVPAVPETQTLGTTTTADVVGLAMETDAGVWTTTNDPATIGMMGFTNPTSSLAFPDPTDTASISQLTAAGGSIVFDSGGVIISIKIPVSLLNVQIPGAHGPFTWNQYITGDLLTNGFAETDILGTSGGIHTGALDPGQVQYTTAYDANIVAQAGHTVLTKSMNIDTRNKVISQSNLNAQTGLTYAATSDGGNVVGSENLMLDGAGMNTTASDKILCPFAAGIANAIPAYCNIVQAGSKYDLTIGSVTTTADNRFVGSDASIPVVLNYNINVKPYSTAQGQFPASGSAMAYIKAHVQEARNNVSKAEDLTYSETSSASGRITAFTKVMSYSSQVTGSLAKGMHIITPSGPGITPNTPVTVPDGGSTTFYATHGGPFGTNGYLWLVDGQPGGTDPTYYTFTNVVSDHTISRGGT